MQMVSGTGGAVIIIPEAKYAPTARSQMTGMITGVMKGSEAPQVVSVQPRALVLGATQTLQIDAVGLVPM